jgi:hypothetical protein
MTVVSNTDGDFRQAWASASGDDFASRMARRSLEASARQHPELERTLFQLQNAYQAELDIHLSGERVHEHETDAASFANFVSGIADAVKEISKQAMGRRRMASPLRIVAPVPGSVRVFLRVPPTHGTAGALPGSDTESQHSRSLSVIASIFAEAGRSEDLPSAGTDESADAAVAVADDAAIADADAATDAPAAQAQAEAEDAVVAIAPIEGNESGDDVAVSADDESVAGQRESSLGALTTPLSSKAHAALKRVARAVETARWEVDGVLRSPTADPVSLHLTRYSARALLDVLDARTSREDDVVLTGTVDGQRRSVGTMWFIPVGGAPIEAGVIDAALIDEIASLSARDVQAVATFHSRSWTPRSANAHTRRAYSLVHIKQADSSTQALDGI